MGQMYKNSEEEFIDEETTIKHLEKIELKRREKFVNEKVKEWSDFLFHVEDMIQNFSSFPVQKQSEIMQFIFD